VIAVPFRLYDPYSDYCYEIDWDGEGKETENCNCELCR